VDDQQVRLPTVARVPLEGDYLQFTPSVVGPDIEPGIGTTGRGDRGRFGGGQDVPGGGSADAVLAR
jgi:hypothetical protein